MEGQVGRDALIASVRQTAEVTQRRKVGRRFRQVEDRQREMIFCRQIAQLIERRRFPARFPRLDFRCRDASRLCRVFKRYLGAVPRPDEQLGFDEGFGRHNSSPNLSFRLYYYPAPAIRFRIRRASATLSLTTEYSRGDDCEISASRAKRTAAMIDAAMTTVEAKRSCNRRSPSSLAMARRISPIRHDSE